MKDPVLKRLEQGSAMVKGARERIGWFGTLASRGTVVVYIAQKVNWGLGNFEHEEHTRQ